jgi:predicted HTH transcriptional regulator
MANVIRQAYMKLAGEQVTDGSLAPEISVEKLVDQGETTTIEFKATLRINLHTGDKDPRMEHGILKTIAAFLNSHGGTLIIGVMDDGSPVGIEKDGFLNEDKMALHLVNLLRDRLGPQHMMYIHPRFDDYQGQRVLAVECRAGKSPVFLRDGQVERFYIRTGASSTELSASQTQSYIKQRFLY